METAGYASLARQSGLLREMRVVANNIANTVTTGYRQEGLVFSEFVHAVEGSPSLSMTRAEVRNTSMVQGTLTQTAGQFDFAIEGDGFFLVETPDGERLTRAGSFAPNAQGDLVTKDGFRVLSADRAPIFVPTGSAEIRTGADGTLTGDGQPIGRLGVFQTESLQGLMRDDGITFRSDAEIFPAEEARVLHGFLEGSNVDPVLQMARLVEIQRAYETGQSFLDAEDERIRGAIKALMR